MTSPSTTTLTELEVQRMRAENAALLEALRERPKAPKTHPHTIFTAALVVALPFILLGLVMCTH